MFNFWLYFQSFPGPTYLGHFGIKVFGVYQTARRKCCLVYTHYSFLLVCVFVCFHAVCLSLFIHFFLDFIYQQNNLILNAQGKKVCQRRIYSGTVYTPKCSGVRLPALDYDSSEAASWGWSLHSVVVVASQELEI